MILAKDKHGRIGRKIPTVGFDAEIETPHQADRRGNVYLSPQSLEAEEAARAQEEAWANAKRKAIAIQREAKAKAQEIKRRLEHEDIMRSKAAIKNRDEELLAAYFKRQMGMSEEDKVARSLVTADFSASGGDPQIVPGDPEYKGVWGADYRWEKRVNNPLSRNGVFGVGTTDFDQIVKGTDVHQWNIPQPAPQIVGGTMVGKYDDVEGRVNRGGMGSQNLGWDWSWDSISEGISDLADKTWDQLQDQLPDEIANQITKELGQITGGSSSGGTGVVNVTRPIYQPVTNAANTAAQTLGVPPWAIYAGVGMIGLGLLIVVLKK